MVKGEEKVNGERGKVKGCLGTAQRITFHLSPFIVHLICLYSSLLTLNSSLSATVPQKSQDDYYFSIPNATNSVTRTNLLGQVIGQPPAYRSLRREDVAWLREAACERAALAAGSWWTTNSVVRKEVPAFGHFPLSHTNRFSRYTIAREWRNGNLETNVVVGWNWVTNDYGKAYKRPSEATGKDLAKPENLTGIDVFGSLSFGADEYRYISGTNGLLQGAQHIKGGQFPAHTNIVTTVVTNWGGSSWGEGGIEWHYSNVVDVVTMPMTNGTTSVHTNAWRVSLPWETTSVSTNVTQGSVFDLLFDGREAKWDDAPAPAAMRPFPVYSYVTNAYAFLKGKRWLVDATANTNRLRSITYKWRFNHPDYPDEWHVLPDTRTNYTDSVGLHVSSYNEGYEAGNGRLVFPTRFAWDVVHTGGVCRIKSATLYACVDVYADWWTGSSYTNAWGHYVKNVGTASKIETPQGGKVCYEATVDGPSIANDGAAAIGAPTRGSWAAWEDDEADYSVSFFLVYELQPWASLPGWND